MKSLCKPNRKNSQQPLIRGDKKLTGKNDNGFDLIILNQLFSDLNYDGSQQKADLEALLDAQKKKGRRLRKSEE